jgi:hypothetical protein
MTSVKDHRAADRFIVIEPLPGSFGGAAVTILNMAHQGVQIEHAQPLRLSTKARLWFKHGAVAASVQGTVLWSHLSRTPNEQGKLLYRSGVRIDEDMKPFRDAMEKLATNGLIRLDVESLERKRRRIEELERARTGAPTVTLMRGVEATIPSDQVLLIQQARERLQANPDEALKWYNRAKFSTTDETILHHREDVLAVWEYLDRSVDLATILRVIDGVKAR